MNQLFTKILRQNLIKNYTPSFKFYSTSMSYQIPSYSFSIQNYNSQQFLFNKEEIDNRIKDIEIKEENKITIELKGRNSKQPKRANHGARPCSSVMRRLKYRAFHRKLTAK
jgi:uncharacterized membrane protein